MEISWILAIAWMQHMNPLTLFVVGSAVLIALREVCRVLTIAARTSCAQIQETCTDNVTRRLRMGSLDTAQS
jgi:hypothetical protein